MTRVGPARPSAPTLICFPHAGSGASTFWRWRHQFQVSAEILAVQLPGRENRMAESRFTTLEPMVEALADALADLTTRRYAFFGHSMGALVSFELTRLLRRRGLPLPRFLAVSGLPAPQVLNASAPGDDAALKAMLHQLGYLGGETAADPDSAALLGAMLPLLRDDLTVAATYRYRAEAPLPCPVLAFGGDSDPVATPDDVRAWKAQAAGEFEATIAPGGHFHLFEPESPVLAALYARLADGSEEPA
ncbi:alpha/beta fold hydrolase [Actinomycetes bacterium KLBMP 9797]